jgi:hypothetical protein
MEVMLPMHLAGLAEEILGSPGIDTFAFVPDVDFHGFGNCWSSGGDTRQCGIKAAVPGRLVHGRADH